MENSYASQPIKTNSSKRTIERKEQDFQGKITTGKKLKRKKIKKNAIEIAKKKIYKQKMKWIWLMRINQ